MESQSAIGLVGGHEVFWDIDENTVLATLAGSASPDCERVPLRQCTSLCEITHDFLRANRRACQFAEATPAHHLFEIQAQLNPGALAVECAARSVTYGELDNEADRLAARLQRHGLGPNAFCALYMAPSASMVGAMLAILKSGAACLLLDATTPPRRLFEILFATQPQAMLAEDDLIDQLDSQPLFLKRCMDDGRVTPAYDWPQEHPLAELSPAFACSRHVTDGEFSIVLRSHSALCGQVGVPARIASRAVAQTEVPLRFPNYRPGSSRQLPDRRHSIDLLAMLAPLSHGGHLVLPQASENRPCLWCAVH